MTSIATGQVQTPTSATLALQRRAHEIIPGGAHTYAKGDDQYPETAPPFIATGRGPMSGLDGNEAWSTEWDYDRRVVMLSSVIEACDKFGQRKQLTVKSPRIECAETFLHACLGRRW